MTTTAIATHTVGVEPVTRETAPYCPATARRAVVERYDGRLVKVVATDADQLHGTLQEYAQAAAHAYGADLADPPTDDIAKVLHRAARHVAQPVNASLPEALRTVTRDQHLASRAVDALARVLHRHPRDLPMWDVTRPRDQVADMLRLAARIVQHRPAATR